MAVDYTLRLVSPKPELAPESEVTETEEVTEMPELHLVLTMANKDHQSKVEMEDFSIVFSP